MKRLDFYLIREGIPPLLFGLMLYSGLAVVSSTLPRMQWLVNVPPLDMGRWLLLQLPTAMVQTLPIALVLAVLLAYGRLAANNELPAMQAGGVPLLRTARPFLMIGLIATLAALAANQWLLPVTHRMVGSEYWELTANRSGLFRLASQNLIVRDFTLTFSSVDGRSDTLRNVRVERWDGDTVTLILSDTGRFEGTDLVLRDYRTVAFDLAALEVPGLSAAQRLEALVPLYNRPIREGAELTITTDVTVDELISRFGQGGFEDPRSLLDVRSDSMDPALSVRDRRTAEVLLHRKLAEPVSNLVLVVAALPLAILFAHSRALAFGLSLVVTLAWYLLLAFGQLFGQSGVTAAWLGPWLGNILLGGLGVMLLMFRVRIR